MDQLTKCVACLALCPGSYHMDSKVCETCNYHSVQNCREALYKRTAKLYTTELLRNDSNSPFDLELRVTETLMNIGVPAHIKGHKYLHYGIELAVCDPMYLDQVTSRFYVDIAKQFDTTPSRVERAIRHAIEVAWDRGDLDTLQLWFGNTISGAKGKPTNSEFIARVSETLRLEMQRRSAKRG